jgi:hypothetical protein
MVHCDRFNQRFIAKVIGFLSADTGVAGVRVRDKEAPMETKKVGTSGLAIAALVLGIVGLLMVPLSIPAIICGALGVGRTGEGKKQGHGMAVAGLVLGCIDLVFLFIALIIIFA